MKGFQYRLERRTLEIIYIIFVRPILEYGNPLWAGCTDVNATKIGSVQLTAVRIISGTMYGTSNTKAL
mgnify:CR=1 FL=1